MIDCPYCNGQGGYPVPNVDDPSDWEQEPCQICETKGKITIEKYRMVFDQFFFRESCRIENQDGMS